ncbi:hypothetical protein Pelo_17060 [Pelomyxa schiedti]|nr:hypothetical protein Pelo_17060 [Pelomyxa schiedti]
MNPRGPANLAAYSHAFRQKQRGADLPRAADDPQPTEFGEQRGVRRPNSANSAGFSRWKKRAAGLRRPHLPIDAHANATNCDRASTTASIEVVVAEGAVALVAIDTLMKKKARSTGAAFYANGDVVESACETVDWLLWQPLEGSKSTMIDDDAHRHQCSGTTSGGIVKLNVGGRVFTTTRTTLSMPSHCGGGGECSSSFFTVLLSGKFSSTLDETGAFFIDRNGDLFAPILDFMRTGLLFVPPTLNPDAVYNEAEYYQIQLPDRPPAPTTAALTEPRAPFVYDFMELRVTQDTRWNGATYVTSADCYVTFKPGSSDLQELVTRIPKDVFVANVVTFIEANSCWRVLSWKEKAIQGDYNSRTHGRFVQVYLYKHATA